MKPSICACALFALTGFATTPLGIPVAAVAQQPVSSASQNDEIMLAAISRDESMLRGGIGPSKWTLRGTVAVEPLAHLTPSGEWSVLPCSGQSQKGCVKFAHDYLSKPHVYTVVSADGKGAAVHAAPATLTECYDYASTGSYSGAAIAKSAIAASSADIFADSPPLRLKSRTEIVAVRNALAALVPKRLDSTEQLRVFAVRVEGQDLFVIQRAFEEIRAPDQGALKLVFLIGSMDQGQFHVLHWERNILDEDERVLGTIALKSGREFLITVVSDPESHFYHVYGVKAGRLTLVYSGGGSSC